MPCPDGRCLSATAMCESGYCVEPEPDLGGQGGSSDAGEPGRGGLSTGCSCEVGQSRAASSAGLVALLLSGVALLRSRRRRRAA